MAEYIEREAVLKLQYWEGCGHIRYGVVDVADIENIPAADVVEVRHGRWIEAAAYNDGVLNTAYCSVCRNFLPAHIWDYHNYCPNCGARMGGE